MLAALPPLPSIAPPPAADPQAWRAVLDKSNSYLGGGGSPYGLSRLQTAYRCEREYAWRYAGAPVPPRAGAGAPPTAPTAPHFPHLPPLPQPSLPQPRLPTLGEVAEREGRPAQAQVLRLADYVSGERYYEPEEDAPEARTFGSVFHDLMAYLAVAPWRADLRPAWFDAVSLQDRVRATAGVHQHLIPILGEVYAAYSAHFANDEYEPLAVEALLRAQLRDLDPPPPGPRTARQARADAWPVTGLADAVVRRRSDGSLWLLDYKTSRRRDWGWKELSTWTADNDDEYFGQAATYLKIFRHLGAPVRGFVVRRVKWSLPYLFDDHAVDLRGLPYEEHSQTLRALVEREVELAEKLEDGGAPTPNFTQCRRVWGQCPYWSPCHVDSEGQRLLQLARYRRAA